MSSNEYNPKHAKCSKTSCEHTAALLDKDMQPRKWLHGHCIIPKCSNFIDKCPVHKRS